jgi:Ca2+-binding EF-hand superfamily protein
MDRDNSGSISANELANVAVGGSVLGIDNGMKLIRVFDVDGNGTIGTFSFSVG